MAVVHAIAHWAVVIFEADWVRLTIQDRPVRADPVQIVEQIQQFFHCVSSPVQANRLLLLAVVSQRANLAASPGFRRQHLVGCG